MFNVILYFYVPQHLNISNSRFTIEQCIHYDGISSGTICCAQSCGICGGSGCGRRNGGARNCCGGKIRSTCGENGRKAPCRLSKI